MKKAILIFPLASFLFVACGENSHDTKQKVENKAINEIINTPEKVAFLENKKNFKNLSEITLGISEDGYSGKYLANKKKFRKVNIPSDYKKRTTKITGKILNNIKNARVCLDINSNNLCDNNEPLTLSKDDSSFELMIEPKDENKYNILSIRGENNDTLKKEISIFKTKNKNNAILSSFSTLLSFNILNKNKLEDIYGNLNNNDLETYKNLLILDKSIKIITSSFNLTEDKEIIKKQLDIYKIIASNLNSSNSLTEAIEKINDNTIKKTTNTLKELINQTKDINLSTENKEAFTVVLNSKINEAIEHFKSSSEILKLKEIKESTLKDDAIVSRLKEIGIIDISEDMLSAAKNLKVRELEDISKIKDYPALIELKKHLEKKEKATSNLIILKALLIGNKLEVYFSENITENSIKKIKSIDNIEQVYNIIGLNYSLEESNWDEKSFKNTLTFKELPILKDEKKYINIKYLAIEDTHNKFSREKPILRLIELPKSIPSTGQEKVWAKYDDGSYSYGHDLKYEKSTALPGGEIWENEKANLMWQDSPYEDGKNENITQAQAVKYCENLSYAGYDDWKLPNVKELVSTTSVNLQKKPIFDNHSSSTVSFSGSDQSAFLGERVVGVDKYGKVATVIHIDEKYSARCVRTIDKKKGSLFPDNAFDNIVMYKKDKLSYDPSTGIMYQDEPFTSEEKKARDNAFKVAQKDIKSVGKFGTFEHAVEYCNKLNDGKGYEKLKGWRLANVNEMFYSLNSKGSRTFQNRIGGFDYTLTSSSSYKDGVKYPWMVGNHFARVLVHNRSAGFFRCIRNMDESELKEAREKNAPKLLTKNRRFKLNANKEVTITLPKNIFDKYEGIRLAKHSASDILDDKEYEISELISRDETIENYTIKSISADGQEICTTNTSYDEINGQFPSTQCDEKGLFRIYVNRDLALNRYGDSILEKGKTYKIVLNNRINDFTVNLKISKDEISDNSNDNSGNDTGDNSSTTSDIKLTKITKTIEISAASGNRIQNNTRHILSSGEDYPNAPKFIEKENSGKIKELKILSGNKDNIFEVYQEQGNMYWQVRVKDDKISTLETNKEYTLILQVTDGFDKKTNTIEIKIKVVTPAIKAQNIEVSIADAKSGYAGGYKLKGTNEPILYTLYKESSPYYKDRLDVIKNANAKEEEIKYELEENETFKLLRFNIEYGNYYAIVLKNGKTPKAKEELNLKAIVSYVEKGLTKTQESSFTVTITNSENKNYVDIQTQTKTDGTNGIELEILTDEPNVIVEKFPAQLKDYTYDNSEYKIYPSSPSYNFVIVPLSKIIEKEATTEGDTIFEIVSGNDKNYFKTEVYGTDLKIKLNENRVPEVGTYTLSVKRTQSKKSSNTANITFTVSEIQAPSVIEETVKLNLTDKNRKNDSYYAEESTTTKVTPIFIFDFAKNKYNPEKFGILKRDDIGNNLLNGSKNLKYKLINDDSNAYEVKEFYQKKWGDPEKKYGIFLKKGKSGNIPANLKIQIIGEFNGSEYPNPTPANVDIEFKVDEFTLKSEVLTVKTANIKTSYDADKHKYFSLVTKKPSSWSADSSVFPFSDIGSYENVDSLKFEIDGVSNNYIIKKIIGSYSTDWELQLKDGGSEAKTETLTIKVTGILEPSHIGTFELRIIE